MYPKECNTVFSIFDTLKIKQIILSVSFTLLFLNVNAQYNQGFKNYKGEFIKHFKFGLGWGWVETDQKPLYVLDGFSGWSGKWLPTTLSVDYRIEPRFRLNLGISHTKYLPRYTDSTGTIAYGGKETYFGADFNLLYNFRAFKHWYNLKPTWSLKNLHNEKFYFDGYFLTGIGVYNPISIPILNTGVGGDFWITYRWGINFQTIAKWSLDSDNRFHMHHQFGVVFHVDQGNDAGALGALRQRNKRKKKPKAVIPEKRDPPSDNGGGDDDFDDFTD